MRLFNFKRKGTPPIFLKNLNMDTKQGQTDKIHKSYIPYFLYRPPFGYPRYVNIPYIRQLASSGFVEMCISTIIEEFTSLEWNVVPKDDSNNAEKYKKDIENAEYFFDNPNTQGGWENLMRKYVRDILEIDSGVINKVYDRGENLAELLPRAGETFTKNPDIHGVFDDREDIMIEKEIIDASEVANPRGVLLPQEARNKAAYFQYGWFSGMRPIPFGKKEIIWGEKYPRTDDRYGRSPVQVLAESIQTLIYSVEHNLEYFNNNSIPKGIIGLDSGDTNAIKDFRELWEQQQKTKDKFGNIRQKFHNLPILNKSPKFERLQFSNEELQLIEQQKWFSKMVFASFGVTPSELGYTDESNRATEIIQSRVFKRKAINPLVRMVERQMTREVLPELGYEHLKFKFNTFDIDEEKNKAELYKSWVDNGIRTANEIRQREGLEPVEWGDSPPKKFQQSSNPLEKMNEEQEEKSIEGKPFGEYSSFQDCVNKNKDKKNPEAYCAQIEKNITGEWPGKKTQDEKEEKALGTYDGQSKNPLVIGENEVPDEKRFEKAIKYWIRQKREEIIDLLEKGTPQETKSVDDVKDQAEKVLSAEALREITQKTVKHLFEQSRQNMEKKFNMNFTPNQKAIDYLQDHVFSNIKDMTQETANDLRAELERGFINGESTNELKKRVKKSFTEDENRAEAIARSETTRATNQGELQSLRSSKKNFKKQWVSAMDERTSEICKRLNGQEKNLDENFEDKQTGWKGKAPPSHVNCRSTLTYEPIDTPEENLEQKKKKERLEELGKKEQKTKDDELNNLIREKEERIKNRENENAKKKQSIIDKLKEDLNE